MCYNDYVFNLHKLRYLVRVLKFLVYQFMILVKDESCSTVTVSYIFVYIGKTLGEGDNTNGIMTIP